MTRRNTVRGGRAHVEKDTGENALRKEADSGRRTPKQSANRAAKGRGSLRQGNGAGNPETLMAQLVITGQSDDCRLQNLEYDILFDIFQYASEALKKEGQSGAQWLRKTAKTCKSFMRPALAALYYAPPLNTSEQAVAFAKQLESADCSKNEHLEVLPYRYWVKQLRVEALPVLTHKDHGNSMQLAKLISMTPQLRSLSLEVCGDLPQHKRAVINITTRGSSKVYDENWVAALSENKISLNRFKWNYFFNRDQAWPWSSLTEIHTSTAFQSVQHLDIVWLNTFTRGVNQDQQQTSLIESLRVLPKLKSLAFTLSILNSPDSILDEVPAHLQHLTIVDCDIDTNRLESYLHHRGQNLRSLILYHNRSLNLSFTRNLASCAPKLEKLVVDLSCFGLLISITDSEPDFYDLFPEESTATWSSALRHLELNFLRRWNQEDATRFFRSILDSSPRLPDLRVLIISASVDMEWRKRPKFRDEWNEKFQLAFKRQDPDPTRFTRDAPVPQKSYNTTPASNSPTKTRTRKRRADEALTNGSGRPPKRSARLRQAVSESPGSGRGSTNSRDAAIAQPDFFIQGKCHRVEFKIGNLRPRETQYTESDFLDDEVSGDADWTGVDAEPDD